METAPHFTQEISMPRPQWPLSKTAACVKGISCPGKPGNGEGRWLFFERWWWYWWPFTPGDGASFVPSPSPPLFLDPSFEIISINRESVVRNVEGKNKFHFWGQWKRSGGGYSKVKGLFVTVQVARESRPRFETLLKTLVSRSTS